MRRLTLALLRFFLWLTEYEIAIYDGISPHIPPARAAASQRRDRLSMRIKAASPI